MVRMQPSWEMLNNPSREMLNNPSSYDQSPAKPLAMLENLLTLTYKSKAFDRRSCNCHGKVWPYRLIRAVLMTGWWMGVMVRTFPKKVQKLVYNSHNKPMLNYAYFYLPSDFNSALTNFPPLAKEWQL